MLTNYCSLRRPPTPPSLTAAAAVGHWKRGYSGGSKDIRPTREPSVGGGGSASESIRLNRQTPARDGKWTTMRHWSEALSRRAEHCSAAPAAVMISREAAAVFNPPSPRQLGRFIRHHYVGQSSLSIKLIAANYPTRYYCHLPSARN